MILTKNMLILPPQNVIMNTDQMLLIPFSYVVSEKMPQIHISITEIIFLAIFFTGLAIYLNIHGENHVLSFTIDHVLALLIALIISKILYHLIIKPRYFK